MTEIGGENIDIICVIETKLDGTVRFLVIGYNKSNYLDIAARKRGILLYTKQSYLLFLQLKTFEISDDIKVIPFELNLGKVFSFVTFGQQL